MRGDNNVNIIKCLIDICMLHWLSSMLWYSSAVYYTCTIRAHFGFII